MYRKHKIGRNDPCPCGSGKKYKRCCGTSTGEFLTSRQEPDYFMINRAIAYKGRIGRQREDFCVNYIRRKKKRIKELQNATLKICTTKGDTIRCQKGCCFCCYMYVEATLQECEAIVYYVYQNENVLTTFLRRYPQWRENIKENGDLFKSFWNQEVTPENAEAEKRYHKQNIPCPFLDNQSCSIYEVRPFLCATHYAVSPPEWCNPQNPNKPDNRTAYPLELMTDRSFYYGKLDSAYVSFMPIAVYEILKAGTYYFSAGGTPTLQNLDYEFCSDPEVIAILRMYGVLD